MLRFATAQLKLRNRYTTESFYDRICAVQFEAGTPRLVRNGPVCTIVFPAQDKSNQIQIRADRKGRIRIHRSFAPILLDCEAPEAGPDSRRKCMEILHRTARQLSGMGL